MCKKGQRRESPGGGESSVQPDTPGAGEELRASEDKTRRTAVSESAAKKPPWRAGKHPQTSTRQRPRLLPQASAPGFCRLCSGSQPRTERGGREELGLEGGARME